MEHELSSVAHFTQETVGVSFGIPVLRPLEQPYFRYYCTCGTVGGKRSTHEAAVAAFNNHVQEVSIS